MNGSTEQRRNAIIDMIEKHGEVRVSELARAFGTSEVTVRFDLETLEAEGLLCRVHGGAVGTGRLYSNMDLRERYSANAPAKKAIAEYISGMIGDNDTLMMNAGTTLTYVLRAIKSKKNISIVTNSISNAIEASTYPDFSVTLLGGDVDAKYQFTYGNDAVMQAKKYNVDKLILSVDGISAETGLSVFYSSETEIIRSMMERCNSVIVAADRTKLGRNAFARICPLDGADLVVTNRGAELDEAISARVKVAQA